MLIQENLQGCGDTGLPKQGGNHQTLKGTEILRNLGFLTPKGVGNKKS